MITIGYKSKFSGILRALSAIAIGLVMVISTDATIFVVKLIAAFLFAAGVVSFIYGYVNRKSGALSLMCVNASVDILIGLVLFAFPGAVAGFIVFIIGLVLLIFGLMQLLALTSALNFLGGGGSFSSLALTVLVILGGIVLIFNPFTKEIMSIIAGVMLIMYGVQELISAAKLEKAKKDYDVKFTMTSKPIDTPPSGNSPFGTVKDVDYEKVDEQ